MHRSCFAQPQARPGSLVVPVGLRGCSASMKARHACRPTHREVVRLPRRSKHPAAARARPDVSSALRARVTAIMYHPYAQAFCVEAVPALRRAEVAAREFA